MNPPVSQKLWHWSLKGLNELARMPVEIPRSFYRDYKALYNKVSRYYHDSRRTVPPANVAIDDVEIKALEPGLHGPKISSARAVNIRDIEKNGSVQVHGHVLDRDNTLTTYRHSEIDESFDLGADDAFTRSLQTVYEAVSKDIDNDEALQDLLAKPEWTKQDRETWEDFVSNAVIDHLRHIPGIGSYRNPDHFLSAFTNNAKQCLLYLNDLAVDIETACDNPHRGPQYSFDCGPMAVVAGLQMQWLDRAFLPAHTSAGNYKYAANYFDAVSKFLFYSNDKPIDHAYVVSSATGNVIEATTMDAGKEDISPYHVSAIPGYTFQDFANGVPFVSNGGALYNAKSASDGPSKDTIKAINALYGSDEDLAHSYPHSEIPRIYDALPGNFSPDTPEKYHGLIRIKNELETLYEQHSELGCMFYMRSDRADDQSLYEKMRDREIGFVREFENCLPQLADDLEAVRNPEKVAAEFLMGPAMRYELPFLLSRDYKERTASLKSQFLQYHYNNDAESVVINIGNDPTRVQMLAQQVTEAPDSLDSELVKGLLPYLKRYTGLEESTTMSRGATREQQGGPDTRGKPSSRSDPKPGSGPGARA